jgi:hypothetical protein
MNFKNILERELSEKKAKNSSYSIRALARDIDVPYTSIARVFKSNTELHPKHKYKVGLFLKIPPTELIDFIFPKES